MAQIFDTDPNSNNYFFITGITDNTFKAGNNCFIVNATNLVLVGQTFDVQVNDPNGNSLSVDILPEVGPNGIPLAELRQVYIVRVPSSTEIGIGSMQISATALNIGSYTGSIAFFKNNAYPVSAPQTVPLNKAPFGVTAFPQAQVLWTRNILFDTLSPTDSEVRFFDFPYIEVNPKFYVSPAYPTASYRMATGSCSAIAVVPKNNAAGNFDFTQTTPIYQLYASTGPAFTSMMECQDIRIKCPYIKSFVYGNGQSTFGGMLKTDFIARIQRVVNENTLLLSIPFSTVSALIGMINQDSPYNKNNLTDIHGYNASDDPENQTMYLKNNFYILSIASANYEIIYRDIPTVLPPSLISGSLAFKSLLEIEVNNLRTYCGNISSYKIYGNSLNTPESKTYLASGKVIGDENVASKNFNNGLYNMAGHFYDQEHTSRFWITSSAAVTFSQDASVLIDGAFISHPNNISQADYVIFKDDTMASYRSASYLNPVFGTASYWYAKSNAFLDGAAQPSASYYDIVNIPTLLNYTSSQENLLSGQIHDSNSIRLRKSTLYNFSMLVAPAASNGPGAALYVYFLGANSYKKQIGVINTTFKSITDELYSNTFYSDIEQYGTIIFVPVSGAWYISKVSITPYQSLDYSLDSFSVKIPFSTFVKNELFQVEVELYDESNRLAYGNGAYTFKYNKIFSPLIKTFFVDSAGLLYDND